MRALLEGPLLAEGSMANMEGGTTRTLGRPEAKFQFKFQRKREMKY